jgi:para-nitrobenzyl esterase
MFTRRSLWLLAILAGCAGADEVDPAVAPALRVAPASSADGTLVQTRDGAVRGVVEGQTLVWRGIPTAAPPVGPLRWRLPQPVTSWSGVRDASAWAPVCPQHIPGSPTIIGDEDCLYLNVFAPASARAGASLPVAFWIHGGGRVQGSGRIDPAALVAQGVVVVSVQYRLGAAGFLAHAGLTAESGTSGDWGFYDMIAGLRWVRANIARFGGDTERVMIFGESSGASAVNVLLVSPLARGTFTRAVMQSNSIEPDETRPLAEAEAAGATFASRVPCAGTDAEQVACLRATPAYGLVRTSHAGLTPPFLLAIDDGHVITGNIAETIHKKGAGVPLIIGSTREEESIDFLGQVPDDVDTLDQVAAADFPGLSDALLPLYPVASYDSPIWALIALESDGAYTCGVRRLADEAASAEEAQPVYRYLFTKSVDEFRAYHGLDVGFVFGDVVDPLATAMQGYWARFAATGDPNGGGAPVWPAHTAAADNFLELGDTIQVGSAYHDAACDLLVPPY